MAERRMFAKTIIDSDAFLDMSLSTQALYFHLSMRADDDGFVNNPKKIQRMIGCGDDELKMLVAKKFIIPFESGICVIKHWRIHNYIQTDRYKETVYKEEKAHLELKENKAYRYLDTPCIQPVSNLETQVRLGKDRLELGKDSIGKVNNNTSNDIVSSNKLQPIIDKWNSLGLQKLISINPGTNRYKLLNARIKEYGEDKILEAIENIRSSTFLKGQNSKGWTITFDWLVKPNNFLKVIEGNYEDKKTTNNNRNKNKLRFDNFKGRDYDYDDLEKKLLGWDKEEEGE